MIKYLPQELSETMCDCIKIVNLIKAKALIVFNAVRRNAIRTSVILFTLLCVGFHKEKFSQDHLSSNAK